MFTFPVCHYSAAAVVGAFPSSVCFDLDATQSASYSGSGQTWSNLIAVPNDGQPQVDYNVFLGKDINVDTDDPTFSGSGSTGKWTYDGGDLHRNTDAISNTGLLRQMHRSDIAGSWIAVLFKTPGTLPNFDSLWGNGSFTAGEKGVTIFIKSDGSLDFDRNTSQAVVIADAGDVAVNTEHILIVTWDGTSSTNNIKTYLNTKTARVDSLAFTSDTATNTIKFSIGSTTRTNGDAAGNLAADFEIFAISGGDSFLTNAEASGIIDLYEASNRMDRPFV